LVMLIRQRENDTLTHRISHDDLDGGEWTRRSLYPISRVDLNRNEKTRGAPGKSWHDG
jgi:hypothetical protein